MLNILHYLLAQYTKKSFPYEGIVPVASRRAAAATAATFFAGMSPAPLSFPLLPASPVIVPGGTALAPAARGGAGVAARAAGGPGAAARRASTVAFFLGEGRGGRGDLRGDPPSSGRC